MKSSKKILIALLVLIIAIIFIAIKLFHQNNNHTNDDKWLITFDGVGPIHIGMKLEKTAIPNHYQITTPTKTYEFVGKENYQALLKNSCSYVSFVPSDKSLKQISFMISNGVIVRMDITDPTLSTAAGIKVGTPQEKVIPAYVNTPHQIHPDKYSQSGRDLNMLYFNQDKSRAMQFDTNGTSVIDIRIGQTEEVQLVEKCL